MKFGSVATGDSVGALTAHTLRFGDRTLRKGSAISADDAARMAGAGIGSLVAARLEDGDVGEDAAAHELAIALAGPGTRVEAPFTGRSNLFAAQAGLLVLDTDRIHAANAVDEAITVATLPTFRPVVVGEMLATVKIIPYAVPATPLVAALAAGGRDAVAVAPWTIRRVGVVSTLTPALKPRVVDKTLDALAARLAPCGAAITATATVRHEADRLAAELTRLAGGDAELVVVFGASAIADRRDVIPAAIEAAGGEVLHFGMPVDPGNLLLIGTVAGKPVIGAPGCARSPKENGFDWVLHRLLAGLEVTRRDITRLGVGGLLMEIVSRGQPRAGGDSGGDDEE